MEAEVLERLRQVVGYEKGDGIFCPGIHSFSYFSVHIHFIENMKQCFSTKCPIEAEK